MRFDVERKDPENAGFTKAHAFIDALQRKIPKDMPLSRADLHVLVGCEALEAAGGPRFPFSTGRRDFTPAEAAEVNRSGKGGCPFGDGAFNPCGSRLPAADLGPSTTCPAHAPMSEKEAPTINAVRSTFERMGFDDKETVCLIILGHQFGRCHPEVSGNEEAWYAFDPAHWNVYLHGLGYPSVYTMGERQMRPRLTKQGKRQYEMNFGMGTTFMMLISDMCLVWDDSYRKYVWFYDQHRRQFWEDAVKAWTKLTELGCTALVKETTPRRA